jgi:hypothetical protein
MGYVKPGTTGEAAGALDGGSSASTSTPEAVMVANPKVDFKPSRAWLGVVEAEKKKKSAEEVDKMLNNLRSRPHRTMVGGRTS